MKDVDDSLNRNTHAAHPMTATTADRIEKLETLVSHQQRTIEQLNDVVIELRTELDGMRASQTTCERTMQWLMENQQSEEAISDEKPPHY